MSGYESVFLCATRVAEEGRREGGRAEGGDTGFGSGAPQGEAGPFTSARKMAAAAAAVLAALFVGDNGPKSKTDGLLRGNAAPASELIKQLLCISEGTACLMPDTGRGNLAALWPCKVKRGKKKREREGRKKKTKKHLPL